MRVSPSKLGSYESCPLRYRYQYLDKLMGETGSALQIGEWTHKAISAWLGGAEDPWTEILPLVNPADGTAVSNVGSAREFFKIFQAWEKEQNIRGRGEADVGFQFETKRPGEIIEFNGYMDYLLPNAVVEFKTASSMDMWSQERADNSPQTFVYARAAFNITGEWVPVWHVIFVARQKKFVTYVSQITLASYERFVTNRALPLVRAQEFPAHPGQQCWYCPFSAVCSEKFKKPSKYV